MQLKKQLIKTIYTSRGFLLLFFMCFVTACDDFVDVDLPKNQLTAESVFKDAATATAALRHIYAEMRGGEFVSGINSQLGVYTDELNSSFGPQDTFFNHTLSAKTPTLSSWWSTAYNLIYAANSVVEGVGDSTTLSSEEQDQFIGEALFIRAYIHTLLVEIFGPIPYISTTDYIANTKVSRMPEDVVYTHIIDDLTLASNLLGEDISEGTEERIRPCKLVAEALLARVYLYTGNWEEAEDMASHVIGSFVWEPDLNRVFLKNSSGTIWQFKPALDGRNTRDADYFIFTGRPVGVYMDTDSAVINAFELNDLRASNWIGSTTSMSNGITTTWYYAFKYKEEGSTGSSSLEYPVVFRLAEQYLIRAEARAQLGNIMGSQSDINKIRIRAGLGNTTAATVNDLLDVILHERQVELFTEGGHRWFDLKRAGKAAEVLAPIKPGWQDTDILLPVPESEILLNPNLLPQNDGY